MTTDNNDIPDCFGDLDTVFPMTDSGLRETPKKCLERCGLETECLRKAMKGGQAVKVEEEIIDRGTRSGAIGFFERWSRKKQVHQKKQKQKKQKKK